MNYSILLQNNTTKDVSVINKSEVGDSSIYYHFQNIDASSMDEGEYTYYIVSNSSSAEITIYPNDVKKSTIGGNTINVLATGLLRVGDYMASDTSYNSSSTYKQYNG